MPRRLSFHLRFVSLVLGAALSSQSQQPKTESRAAISQALQNIERAWLNAEKNHDAAAFDKYVADDWIAITPDGKTQTKSERAAEIKSAHTIDATMGEMKVRIFGDTAIVTGNDDESSMEGGRKSTYHYVWTDVFVKRNGKWLAVASQTALVK
jgi:ketosteroid isomerase-like protein